MGEISICCLASGNGSNFQALIDAIASGALPSATISLLICNREKAYARQRARDNSIPEVYHNLLTYSKQYPSNDPAVRHSKVAREAYDRDLADIVIKEKPKLVVCAGWMLVFSEAFLNPVSDVGIKVINLHPALPGEFNGASKSEHLKNRNDPGERR